MKKSLIWFTLCMVVVAVSVFGQGIDRSLYRSIDPFDYRLDEDRAQRGAVRRFRSVVRFEGRNGQIFTFNSLDGTTSLDFRTRANTTPPTVGQIVTIYFTATKPAVDTLVLDEIDESNTTEAGIGVVKSSVSASSGIRRADYSEIEIFDYRSEAAQAAFGAVRRFRSVVNFQSQNGTLFTFMCPAEGNPLSIRVSRRFPPFTPNQRVTVFFTATKGVVDMLVLDDVQF